MNPNPNLNNNLTSIHTTTPPRHHQSRHSASIPKAQINIPTLQTPNRTARTPHPRHYSTRKPINSNITTSLLHHTDLHEARTAYPLHNAHTTQPSLNHGGTPPPAHDTSPPHTQPTPPIPPPTKPVHTTPTPIQPHTNERLPYTSQLPVIPPHHHNTRFATWNLDKHAAYSGPLHACALGSIDVLHCPEPSTRFTTPGSTLPY